MRRFIPSIYRCRYIVWVFQKITNKSFIICKKRLCVRSFVCAIMDLHSVAGLLCNLHRTSFPGQRRGALSTCLSATCVFRQSPKKYPTQLGSWPHFPTTHTTKNASTNVFWRASLTFNTYFILGLVNDFIKTKRIEDWRVEFYIICIQGDSELRSD